MGDMQRSIRFPDDLDAKIQAIAEAEDRSFSYVVVRAMERALGDAPRATESRERPAPPRSPAASARTPSPLAARQQALNKSKGM